MSAVDRCVVRVQCTVSLGNEVTTYMVASSKYREMYPNSECGWLSSPDRMVQVSPLKAVAIEPVFVAVEPDLKLEVKCYWRALVLVLAKNYNPVDVADRKSVVLMKRKGLPVLDGQTAPENPSFAASAAAGFPCLFHSAPWLLPHVAVDVAYSTFC